jgi:hypothetical protein
MHEDLLPPIVVTVTDQASFEKFVSAFMLILSVAAFDIDLVFANCGARPVVAGCRAGLGLVVDPREPGRFSL